MAASFDICIRGAGIVGRTLALLLAKQRLRVALVDEQRPPSPGHSDVRAYALSPASRATLTAVRCWPDAQHATPVTAMDVRGDQGGHVHFSAQEQGCEALNWIVDVPTVEALLADAVRFQSGITPMTSPVAAPLTVVCEGKTSRSRQQWGVEIDALPYQQSALAARVHCERPHAQVARQWFADQEIVALLPLDGPEGTTCAVVWSASPARAQALMALDAHDWNAALTQATHASLGNLSLCSPRAVWPLQHASARHWVGHHADGAWALAGDAAHTVHPLAGQGLNLGLGDVAELARILDQRPYWRSVNDRRLLRLYERARKADYAATGGAGDALQRLFHHGMPGVQTLRNWGMNQFERSGPLKQWVARQAMHLSSVPATSPKAPSV